MNTEHLLARKHLRVRVLPISRLGARVRKIFAKHTNFPIETRDLQRVLREHFESLRGFAPLHLGKEGGDTHSRESTGHECFRPWRSEKLQRRAIYSLLHKESADGRYYTTTEPPSKA